MQTFQLTFQCLLCCQVRGAHDDIAAATVITVLPHQAVGVDAWGVCVRHQLHLHLGTAYVVTHLDGNQRS